MDYEIVIGLEVHCQLKTATKIFCGCRNAFTHTPNTHTCPVCLGHPGSLPVLNRAAFALALRAGIALNCTIPPQTKFDRKHYYYPDLPKNYQISQYDMPLSQNGWLDIRLADGGEKRIGITRAHLEEDAGKLIHGNNSSAVDLNRTGTPLLEIVSEPDLRSAAEARSYLELLKLTMLYIDASDCNMEEGSLRCDANISVRPRGSDTLGTKNEIKNMNSFRGTESALKQVGGELIRRCEAGETIEQVTWGYSVDNDKVFYMRTKESDNDYRYFPDPDLPCVTVTREWVAEITAALPELPAARRSRFCADYELSDYDAGVLVQDRDLAEYFEAVTQTSNAPKESANWVCNDVARLLNERNLGVANFPVCPETLGELIKLTREKTINLTTARKLFTRYADGETTSPRELVVVENLGQVSDTGALEDALRAAVADNPKAAQDIADGKPATAMFFVGKVMQAMRGQADPAAVTEVIAAHFKIDPTLLQKKPKKKKS